MVESLLLLSRIKRTSELFPGCWCEGSSVSLCIESSSRSSKQAMAGEMLASAIVKQVAGKLCSSMGTEVGLAWGLEESLKEMESTFFTIEAVLPDADRRPFNDLPLCVWLKMLKDAAYDIDDLLNEFQAKLDDDEERKGGGARILRFFSPSNPPVFRSTMAHRMKKLRRRLDRIAANRIQFHLQESSSVSERRFPEIQKLDTFSADIDKSTIYGRHEDTEKIVRFLLESGEEEEVISVIPIVGLGGIGKTTVAQLAFNDDRVKHACFDLRIWVYVSMDFDLKRVARDIISSGTGASCDLPNLEVMKNRIKELVEGKRFLVVLDDVWTEDADEWEKLKLILRGGARGSKIIVTTRTERVALITGAVVMHRLEGLAEEECWALFKRRAFGSGDEERWPNLVVIGRQIAKKCAGVPLAANALGTICFKRGEEMWLAIRDGRNYEVKDAQDRVLSSLKLSYYEMPAGLKQCFAYCSIFPKGYEIQKDKLIHQWISLGFIQSKDVSFSQMEEIGNEYINILLWMSFLQDLKEYSGGIVTCKMHDLVHDLARSVAAGEIYVVETQKEARDFKECRYALFGGSEEPSKVPKRLLKKVRALHFRGDGSTKLHDSTFSPATSLRALDLGGCRFDELPTSIGKLRQLRYLDAPHIRCEIEPGFLQFLQSLQVLNISSSSFSSLPKSIGNISKLLLINLSSCHNLQNLPTSIGNLQNLHHLNLSHCIKLQDLPVSIGNLQNLHHLNLLHCNKLQDLPASIGNLQNLHRLNLSFCYNLQDLPASIGNLQNLHHLHLSNCKNLQDLPASIGNLQNLHYLNLSHCYNLQDLPASIGNLQNLHHLDLSRCMKFQDLPASISNLQNLHLLDLVGCNSISSFPTEIFDRTNLKHLHVHSSYFIMSRFIVCGGKHINTEELEHQNRTGNELEIIISIDVMGHPRDARRVDLWKKQNVRSLVLRSVSYSRQCYLVDEFVTRVLPYLSPHPNLKVLELQGYMGRSFPSWMIDSKELRLQNLVELTLHDVTVADHLPSLGHLSSLEVLRLKNMHSVKYLSCDAQYPSLKELVFVYMDSLRKWTTATVVDNGKQLCEVYPRLKKLTIKWCPSLMPQPCLPASVVEMVVESSSKAIMSCEWQMGPSSSSSLMSSSASSSSSTSLLKTLYIRDVHSADGWKGLSHHTALEELTIESCNLNSLPDSIQGLTCLQSLTIKCYVDLKSLPDSIQGLTCLRSLIVSNCFSLAHLPELSVHTALEELTIEGSNVLESLPDSIQGLTCLRSLNLSYCYSLRSLPAWLGNLTSLQSLEISFCPSLIVSRDILMEGLTSLLTLKICGCPNLAHLPELLGHISSSLQVEISACQYYCTNIFVFKASPTIIRDF